MHAIHAFESDVNEPQSMQTHAFSAIYALHRFTESTRENFFISGLESMYQWWRFVAARWEWLLALGTMTSVPSLKKKGKKKEIIDST